MKINKFFTFTILPLLIFVFSQITTAQPGFGTVKGTIFIKNVSGNNLGKFGCGNITVGLNELNSPTGKRWSLTRTATGDFSTRKCSFKFDRVPAGKSFVAVIAAEFPNGCDQKSFDANSSFPMEIRQYQTMVYDFRVTKVSCSVVK